MQRKYKDSEKHLNTLRLIEGTSVKSKLTWLLYIKLNKIYVLYSDAQYNRLLRKWIYNTKTLKIQGNTK